MPINYNAGVVKDAKNSRVAVIIASSFEGAGNVEVDGDEAIEKIAPPGVTAETIFIEVSNLTWNFTVLR